ncbi:MAG: GDP-mannose 4,6-dehydratase [Chlamydiae bacterium]|nr:GDP-mannose 4,6-dehydratase [Chlamydiota bacterium]MBI3276786.1 GDP-mannose 4,6-dehydratase [Chlamydiota bacterium]
MKILVTGGAGFIGSHLIGELLAKRHSIVAIDNFDPFYDIHLKKENIKLYQNESRFKFLEIDIRNRKMLSNVFASHRFDVCIHLAAKAGVRPSIQDPVSYYSTNVDGTLNLLEEARLHKLDHFIFGSSSSVYGKRNQIPFTETDALLSPISPYAATKIAGESLCHVYHELYGIRMTLLRFFTVYGPRQRPEMAIHKFTRMVDQGDTLTLYGDGSSIRDYTYVTDIVQGMTAALKGEWGYEIFNLGDSKTVPLNHLIYLIEKNLGKKAKIKKMKDQAGDVPMTFANIAKANHSLNYLPKINIEEGIKNFCQWFLERKSLRTRLKKNH